MIPQKKKSAEEIAALREGMGLKKEMPLPEPEPVNTEIPVQISSPSVVVSPSREPKQHHSLRKQDLPLAPASALHRNTALPTQRTDLHDIAQIRRREALAKLNQPNSDPAAHLRNQTASRLLCVLTYLLSMAAPVTVFFQCSYFVPSALLMIASILVVFIAWKKPRSCHHAALNFIIIFLSLVFGGLHYAPLFYVSP
jgi:hypothetical protein